MDSSDKLTIDTPEQTALEYPIAGLGSRFLAVLADTAIQAVVAFFVLIIGSFLGAGLAAFWRDWSAVGRRHYRDPNVSAGVRLLCSV